MRPEQYYYIAAWGRYLGSQPYYIMAAQEKAAEDNAPADALFRQDDGTWFCRSNMPTGRDAVIYALDRDAARMRGER